MQSDNLSVDKTIFYVNMLDIITYEMYNITCIYIFCGNKSLNIFSGVEMPEREKETLWENLQSNVRNAARSTPRLPAYSQEKNFLAVLAVAR